MEEIATLLHDSYRFVCCSVFAASLQSRETRLFRNAMVLLKNRLHTALFVKHFRCAGYCESYRVPFGPLSRNNCMVSSHETLVEGATSGADSQTI
jgi:hypothetical protein